MAGIWNSFNLSKFSKIYTSIFMHLFNIYFSSSFPGDCHIQVLLGGFKTFFFFLLPWISKSLISPNYFSFHRVCFCCSVAKSCPTLCNPMNCSTPAFPVLYHLLEFVHTPIYWVSDATQQSPPLWPPSPLGLNLSQHASPCESELGIPHW